MNKFIVSFLAGLVLTVSTAAAGQMHHHGHRHIPHHRHWHSPPIHHWVVPALIGGAVVYAATRPDPVVVQQPAPVIVNNQYVVIDGITYKKEIMIVNGIQQEVLVRVTQ